MDVTVALQNITFPTDLKLLGSARRKSGQLIDILHDKKLHGSLKPRTYREIARKEFLNTAKKKSKTARTVYKANGKQIRFLRRNLAHTDRPIAAYDQFLEIGKTFSISHNTVNQFTKLFKASHYSMEDFLALDKAAFDTMFPGHITKK